MTFISFIKSKVFFKHLGLAVAVAGLVTAISYFSIGFYTHHGEAIAVPDFTGMSIEKATVLAENKGLELIVTDSVHLADKEKGSVISQFPEPDHKVKTGRTIYITLNAFSPEMVQMPDLRGISVRQATSDAEIFGLKIGKLSYVPDISTTVLDMKLDGKKIAPGTLIERGSYIDLVVGRGESKEKTSVPNVLAMTFVQAEQKLAGASLNIGVAMFDETVVTSKDSANARVWKQHPRPSKETEISLGSYIDLWLTLDKDLIPAQTEEDNNNEPIDAL